MKTSELIQKLQKAVNDHGDLKILVRWNEEGDNFSNLTISPSLPSPNEEREATLDFIVRDWEKTSIRANELIQKLRMSVETYGDLEVRIRWTDGDIEFSGADISPDPASPEETREGIEGTIDLVIWTN